MIQCPVCQIEIPPADFNVSTDLAFCRQCESNYRYSELIDGQSLPDPSRAEIPKYLSVEDFGQRIVLRYRRLHPMLLFFVPFTAVWAGGSMIAIYGAQIWKGQFDLQQSLFGIPFALGSLVMISVCTYLLFGNWLITLDGPESVVFTGVGPIGWTRRFDLLSAQSVRLKLTSLEINHVKQTGICVVDSEGKEFIFGSTFHEDSKSYIAAVIRKQIDG